jgi:IS5 family transposase
MRQLTLASQAGFEKYSKKTRREKFLEEMDGIMPWMELESLSAPHYPQEGNGRPPVGLGIMLRIYFLQHWFNLSDRAAEEALYDSPALRRFAGVNLGRAAALDETTILNFRHLLERHDLCGAMLDAVDHYLEDRGIRIWTGTIVDATIIHAPSSTKNAAGRRDPAMHETRKGNQWCVSRTRAQARDAVLKMGDGLPESAYRSRLQTARCCCV